MRRNHLWMKATAIALSVCMGTSLGIAPMGNMSYVWAAQAAYVNTFDDASTLNNWNRPIGAGSYTIENGKLVVKTDNYVNESQNPYQLVFDTTSPDVKDGYVTADIENKSSNGRFSIVFRYQDIRNYDCVGYDVGGNWRYIKFRDGQKTEKTIKTGLNVDNASFNLKVEFSGETLVVLKDGQQIYQGTDLDDTMSGKVGVRTWGYSGNYAHITVDNLNYVDAVKETDDAGNYKVSFTDADRRGGFAKLTTAGTLAFTDGQDDAGYMTITSSGHTVVADQNAPSFENGFLEADITMVAGGKFVVASRVQNADNFAGIGYDGGGWFWCSSDANWGGLTPLSNKALTIGKTYRVRMEYIGDKYTLLVGEKNTDGSIGTMETIIESTITQLPKTAGKVGFRVWGSNQSIKVDNVVNGKFNAVLLNPEKKYVLWEDAGSYDVPIGLSQTENAFSKVMVGEEEVPASNYALSEDKATLTIKKEYIASLKEAKQLDTTLSLVFADGYVSNFRLQIQPEPTGEIFERNVVFDGADKLLTKVKGSGNVTFANGKMQVENGNNLILIDDKQDAASLRNAEVEFLFDPKNDGGNFGIVFRYAGADDWTMIGPNSGGGNTLAWKVQTSNGVDKVIYQDANRIFSKRVKPYKVKIRLVENVVTLFKDNEEIFSGVVDGLTDSTGSVGLRYNGGAGAAVTYLNVKSADVLSSEKSEITSKTIASDVLSAEVDQAFPRVIEYTLKENGAKTTGQEKPYYYVEINNSLYKPKVTSEFTATKAIYHVTVDELKVSFDVTMEIKNNTLDYRITNINDTENTIYTINFPNQSLVSMSSEKVGGELRVNNYRAETKYALDSAQEQSTHSATSIAVLSGNDIAASINGGSIKSRQEIAYQVFQLGDHTSTGLWPNEYLYKGLDGEVIEEPWAVVSITGDRNKDSKIDFQDAAIARRDDCYKDEASKKRIGADYVMNTFPMIAMNVGSAAQYPFLRILDNIKKFNLGTDGFPQNIVIKGYQSEGHDASHPDFANYNQRAGGLDDFKTLLTEAEKYNAGIGVHINHTEVYPEAPQYTALASGAGGWSWYDTARQLIRENDILNKKDGMAVRLQQLDEDTLHKLKMIYVDVYFDSRWPAYKLADEITKKMGGEDGVALGTEYVDELTKDSVFAHHIGGYFNSAGNLVRFVNNQEQDIFGQNTLFRGLPDRNFVGIMGWQNSTNYFNTQRHFYVNFLPNKFLAQYPIQQYNKDNEVVLGYNNEVVSKVVAGANVITLNGKEVANGNKIFIPWTVEGQDKIYHWNEAGGASTWDLPNDWSSYANVKVFPLSDQGRGEPVTVNVQSGKVTITAAAKTGYVIYPGDVAVAKSDITTMKWGDGSIVKDNGFDSYTFDYAWKKIAGQAQVAFEKNNIGNTHMIIRNKNGGVTQTLTGLTPGKTYTASVWTYVTEGSVGKVSVRTKDGDVLGSNYIDKSNVMYGVHHTDKYKTYAQRVKVNFTQPLSSTTAELVLEAEQNKDGNYVDFDDVRVVQIPFTEKGEHYFVEDFEHVDEEYGPFVSTEADNSHLSETNEGVTDDTVSGRYSMKVRYGNYLRTMPHTLRFKPNTKYKVTMDYKTWNANAFTFAVKTDVGNKTLESVVSTASGLGNVTLEFTTDQYSDYYLDITKNASGDYVVDNLVVDEFTEITVEVLRTLYDKASALKAEDYTEASFAVLQEKKTAAKQVLDKTTSTEEERHTVYEALNKAIKELVAYAKAADMERLQTAITQGDAVVEADFKKDEAWTNYKNALNEAKALKTQSKVTVVQVDQMIAKLTEAIKNLNTNTDTTKLKALYEVCEKELMTNYVDGQEVQTFLAARTKAKEVLANSSSSQAQIDEAYKTLFDCYEALMPIEKSELSNLIAEAKALNKEEYTPSSYDKLKEALSQAEIILANAKASRKVVNAAVEGLTKAMDQLVKVDIEEPKQGWVIEGGLKRYYEDNKPVSNKWVKGDNHTWSYAGKDGYLFKGWLKDQGIWYYLNEKDDNGTMLTGWQKIGTKWYLLSGSGAMQTGWKQDNGTWYYLGLESGAMQTGWLKLNEVWYYLNKTSGAMETGWLLENGTWYYLKPESGVMQTGWQKVKGEWYLLSASGAMQTGWKKVSNQWYYLKNNGVMATGWIIVDGKYYYLESNGVMASNKWIGNYYVNSLGVWVSTRS